MTPSPTNNASDSVKILDDPKNKPVDAVQNGSSNPADLETKKAEENIPIFKAKDHATEFDPIEYLEGFYVSHKEDGAMQTVLFFLPGILYRLPDKVETLLDLGAGPTVYIPIAVRHRAKNVFTSDYAQGWIQGESKFDWTSICKWLANIESTSESPEEMIKEARKNMRAVLKVNVHEDQVIQDVEFKMDSVVIPKQFDVVTCIFCLEYAGETLKEFKKAVKGATSLIKPGGYLIQGGVLHADEYGFGGKRFSSHPLTREQLVNALAENGMCTTDNHPDFRLIINLEVFLLFSKRRCEFHTQACIEV
uniref:Uncharacterized protein n=1 Tax=Ditylenchus dipsaci TaxID=166011 RepID=A0A915ESH3_9BILA